MKKLFILFILLGNQASSQSKTLFVPSIGVSAAAGPGAGLGFHLAVARKITDNFYAGGHGGFIKFSGFSNGYFPVGIHLSFIPDIKSSVRPVILFEPGYGFYNETFAPGAPIEGGFTFIAGAGIKTTGLMLVAGFTSYNFNFPKPNNNSPGNYVDENVSYSGFTIKLGLIIR
jgi:hypothetical protein